MWFIHMIRPAVPMSMIVIIIVVAVVVVTIIIQSGISLIRTRKWLAHQNMHGYLKSIPGVALRSGGS